MTGRRWLVMIPFVLLCLAGCQYLDAANAAAHQGVVVVREINDAEAEAYVVAAGAIRAGALARLPDPLQRCAVAQLAGLQLVGCQPIAVTPALLETLRGQTWTR